MEERIEDIEEIDTVITELEISKGKGNLILCVVNSPLYRDRIIQTLKRRFKSKVINAEKGEQIIFFLKKKNFNGAEVIIWIMPEEPTDDLLNTLNNFRELYYKIKVPNILFYNQAFSESVIKKAPDFWRYRGNYYEFKEEERGLTFEALEALATPFTYKDEKDLMRRKRINEYLLEKVRDKKEKNNILNELGLIFDYSGQLDEALKFFKMALNLDEELGRKEGITRHLGNIGIIYGKQSKFDEALKYLEKALNLDEESGRNEGIARHLGNIGIIYGKQGKFDEALKYLEKALNLDKESGRNEGIARHLGNIGHIYGKQGKFDEALKYLEKALELDEKLSRKEGIAIQLGNIGHVYRTKGELDKALKYHEKALEVSKEIGNRIRVARALMNIGDIFVLKGEKKRALDYYIEAQNLAIDASILKEITKRLKKMKYKDNVENIQRKTNVQVL